MVYEIDQWLWTKVYMALHCIIAILITMACVQIYVLVK